VPRHRRPRTEIAAAHRKQYFEGKHKGESEHAYLYPYADVPDAEYVIEQIPVEHLRDAEYDENDARVRRYMKLMESGVDMGPSWGKFRTHARNPQGKVYIFDGNHRAAAAKALGRSFVDVILPTSQYEAYVAFHSKQRRR
jgi:hypothetical protein